MSVSRPATAAQRSSVRRTMVAAAAAIFVIWLIAGCGASGSGTSPFSGSSAPVGPTTPASTAASTAAGSDTISGTAKTAVGSPVASVAVGFQLITASCSSCDIYRTVTDSTGQYTLHLPVGTYQAQCVAAAGLTCLIASSPPEVAVRVNVVSNGTVNLLVATPAPATSPGPAPPTLPSPTPPPNPPSGDVVSGHVLTSSGQPVPNAAITFRMGGCPDCEPSRTPKPVPTGVTRSPSSPASTTLNAMSSASAERRAPVAAECRSTFLPAAP